AATAGLVSPTAPPLKSRPAAG
ncbi:hypothetical protein CCACVL1_00634, partial [Corchorus capsularis]